MNTNNNTEPYLTIKELSFELQKLGLPYSRPFIRKHIRKARPVLNRVKLSAFVAVLPQK